jgi:nitrogen fixation/metabolism regulation signal transduction histidine kinase
MKEQATYLCDVLSGCCAGAVIVDPRTRRIECVNDTACTLLGVPAAHLVGRECGTWLRSGKASTRDILDAMVDTGRLEVEISRGDGKSLPAEGTAKRILLDGEQRLPVTLVLRAAPGESVRNRRESETS